MGSSISVVTPFSFQWRFKLAKAQGSRWIFIGWDKTRIKHFHALRTDGVGEFSVGSSAQIAFYLDPAPLVLRFTAFESDPLTLRAYGQNPFKLFDVADGLFKFVDFFPEQSLVALQGNNHGIEGFGKLAHKVDALAIITACDLFGLPCEMAQS